MSRRGLAGATAAAVGSVLLADARDRRRIANDPVRELLFTPPRGEERTIEGAGGTRLNVVCYGPEDAPPVVLIHGWTCALRFWRLQVHDLMADHRVIAYDHRGHGRSGAPADGDWSLDTFADDLECVFDACVPEGRQALVAGHSLGAMTIAAWAGRHQSVVERRVKAAALINTGLHDLITDTLLVKTPDALGHVRQLIGGVVLGAAAPLPTRPDPITHRAVRRIALSKSATPAQVRFCEDMILSTKPRVRAGCGRALSELDVLDDLRHLTVPTLVMAGTHDVLTPPIHAERMADVLPECVGVLELEGAGHMGPIERAAEVNAALRELSAAHLSAAEDAAVSA
jgi:pimeloyl-ACP methyl ester carboxylesterase